MSVEHIALKASSNGQYLCAEGGGGGSIFANRGALHEWETFRLIDLGGGTVALQSHNGHFLCAENNGGQEVVINRTAIGPWETFTLVRHGDGRVSLRAGNGQWVCAEQEGGYIEANRDVCDEWEKFELIAVTPEMIPAPTENWVQVARENLMQGSIAIYFFDGAGNPSTATLSWRRYSVLPPWYTWGTHACVDAQGNTQAFGAVFICDPYCDVWFNLPPGVTYRQQRTDAYGHHTINPCTFG
jgi:hypothetical protein